MNLDLAAFRRFFEEARGVPPFAWQERLVEHVLREGAWPRAIAAPTGTGKTSVVHVHAFLNAVAQETGLRVPRRLVMTVNRRSLADEHAREAEELARHLEQAPQGSVSEQVAARLRGRAASGGKERPPLLVYTVRGGMPIVRDWRESPSACAVLCMTPDMWGSRALFRGYGTSRWARPVEAGLLVRDTVLVVDEAHLNRQLVETARRIAYLDGLATEDIGVPALQVVETTATPDSDAGAVSVALPHDLDHPTSGAVLRARLEKRKPLRVKRLDIKRAQAEKLAEAFAAELLELEASTRHLDERGPSDQPEPISPVGCVVNTVDLARHVVQALRSRPEVAEGDVALVVGGLAPLAAKEILAAAMPGGEGARGPRPRFLVGTQALEVGLDFDVRALVTELAPGSALAQRFGRLNRKGHRDEGPAVVIAPDYDPKDPQVPYALEDLDLALGWVTQLEAMEDGAAVKAVLACPPPPETPQRELFQRLEWPDVSRLARTSEDLAVAETRLPDHVEDLTLWLRDAFDEQAEASAVVRDLLPTDTTAAVKAASLLPPLDLETYRSSLRRVRRLAQELAAAHEAPVLVYRAGTAVALDSPTDLRAGDTLIIERWRAQKVHHNANAAFVWGVHVKELPDLYEEALRAALERGGEAEGYWHLRLAKHGEPDGADGDDTDGPLATAWEGLLEELKRYGSFAEAVSAASDGDEEETAIEPTGDTGKELLDALGRLLDALASPQVEDEPAQPTRSGTLFGSRALGALPLGTEEAEPPAFSLDVVVNAEGTEHFVFVRARPIQQGEEAASEQSVRTVFLDDHQSSVAARAADLARAVGVAPGVADAIRLAAELHDAGKAHPRFQRYLRRGRWGNRPLAKSRHPFDPVWHSRYGLAGWRHEQLSAAVAWSRAGELEDPELVAWLVGTSHGRGRAAFDMDNAALFLKGTAPSGATPAQVEAARLADRDATEMPPELTAASDAAESLFDEGLWEEWCERLSRRLGPWGLAYLEALLRAADHTVSAEGR